LKEKLASSLLEKITKIIDRCNLLKLKVPPIKILPKPPKSRTAHTANLV